MHDHCTAKKVSRQCLAQRAAVLRGLCARECGRAISAEGGVMCDFCRAKNRTAVRARTGCAPWRSGGAGRPPLGKRAETHAIKAAALKKLNPLDRFALCLTPKPERRALRAAAPCAPPRWRNSPTPSAASCTSGSCASPNPEPIYA